MISQRHVYLLYSSCGPHNVKRVQFSFAIFASEPLLGMSRVVSSAHLHLLWPWTVRLLSWWMLPWWWFICNTSGDPFLSAHPLMLRTPLDKSGLPFFKTSNDPSANRIEPRIFGGACSISCTTYSSLQHVLEHNFHLCSKQLLTAWSFF